MLDSLQKQSKLDVMLRQSNLNMKDRSNKKKLVAKMHELNQKLAVRPL